MLLNSFEYKKKFGVNFESESYKVNKNFFLAPLGLIFVNLL